MSVAATDLSSGIRFCVHIEEDGLDPWPVHCMGCAEVIGRLDPVEMRADGDAANDSLKDACGSHATLSPWCAIVGRTEASQ